jgi:flagellar basal body-associated protein FliL
MEKNKGMMMIIIVMLGLIIAAITVGAILLLGMMNNDQAHAQEEYPGYVQEISGQDIRTFTLSNDITTNLLSPEGERHIVRVTVGIGINDIDEDEASDFIDMMLEREIAILDLVTGILRSTTRDQLAAVGGSEAVSDRILVTLQDYFGSQLIVRVYLGNLVTS